MLNNFFQDHFDSVFYRARQVLLEKEPFYSYLLNQCAIRENKEVGTISIQEEHGTIYLVYSDEWTETLSEIEVASRSEVTSTFALNLISWEDGPISISNSPHSTLQPFKFVS